MNYANTNSLFEIHFESSLFIVNNFETCLSDISSFAPYSLCTVILIEEVMFGKEIDFSAATDTLLFASKYIYN